MNTPEGSFGSRVREVMKVSTYDLEFIVGFWAIAERQDVVSNVAETVRAESDQGPPGQLVEKGGDAAKARCKFRLGCIAE